MTSRISTPSARGRSAAACLAITVLLASGGARANPAGFAPDIGSGYGTRHHSGGGWHHRGHERHDWTYHRDGWNHRPHHPHPHSHGFHHGDDRN